jgi:hypothetical protein
MRLELDNKSVELILNILIVSDPLKLYVTRLVEEIKKQASQQVIVNDPNNLDKQEEVKFVLKK